MMHGVVRLSTCCFLAKHKLFASTLFIAGQRKVGWQTLSLEAVRTCYQAVGGNESNRAVCNNRRQVLHIGGMRYNAYTITVADSHAKEPAAKSTCCLSSVDPYTGSCHVTSVVKLTALWG
jgi:hypothetical protein